jgi:A/G-specific adenine glycosylase
MEEYGGTIPADYKAVLSLKGIGSYTAGAICSIAYEIPVPAVDGNVLRVLMRVHACGEDISRAAVKKEVEQTLLAVMPQGRSGAFNQSLMELGATVCLPNGEPLCDQCPLSGLCLAKLRGTQMEYPVKAAKKARRIEQRTILLISDGEKILLKKRPKRGLLAGLYEFPNLEGHLTEEQILSEVETYGRMPLYIRRLPDAKHIFSHVEWHMQGYFVKVDGWEDNELFVEVEDIREKYPVPSAFEAYKKYL